MIPALIILISVFNDRSNNVQSNYGNSCVLRSSANKHVHVSGNLSVPLNTTQVVNQGKSTIRSFNLLPGLDKDGIGSCHITLKFNHSGQPSKALHGHVDPNEAGDLTSVSNIFPGPKSERIYKNNHKPSQSTLQLKHMSGKQSDKSDVNSSLLDTSVQPSTAGMHGETSMAQSEMFTQNVRSCSILRQLLEK